MEVLIVGRGWTGMKCYSRLREMGVQANIISHRAKKFITSDYRNRNLKWILNCAGMTGTPNVDACEKIPEETMNANALFPIELYEICKRNNIRFAHFSSGCIYTGEIKDEYASPNFFGSVYSISKGASDAYLKDKCALFRIRMPFNGNLNDKKNYLTKVINYAKTAKLYDGGLNSLTDHDEAVRVACQLIAEDCDDRPYNLVNSGSITMREIANILELECDWFTDQEFSNATAAGRSNCTIPSFYMMSDVHSAIHKAAVSLKLQK